MQSTPKSLRLHIGLFGRRNVGKSSLLNAITRQQVSIVSAHAGTTTDPVEKPMELLPLGPVQFVDTAGVDDEGALGDPDPKEQEKAVKNHYRWVEWAKYLGCHSIRVNAETGGKGTFDEAMKRAAHGLAMLTEFGVKHGISVIVENHGGLSSNGKWLSGVMKIVNSPSCGTLPDFGNFYEYDRYKGVEEMMPFAKGVSAKSHDFDEKGNDSLVDYERMLKIVKAAGYRWHIGIEYEGEKLPEPEGIRATKKLLERLNG